MSIFVVDNNRCLSAHALYIIEADKEEFDKIWSLYQKAWPKHSCCNRTCKQLRYSEPCSLVAVLDKIEWYEGEPASIRSWLYDTETRLYNYTADIEAAKEFMELAKTYVPDFYCEPLWLYVCVAKDKR